MLYSHAKLEVMAKGLPVVFVDDSLGHRQRRQVDCPVAALGSALIFIKIGFNLLMAI